MIQMNLTPPVAPERIDELGTYLNIPIYQRLFEWEDQQIQRLLDDLWEVFSHNKKTDYYIGSITCVRKNDKVDIVDGQQRLTFLFLFGAYVMGRPELPVDQKADWRKFVFSNSKEGQSSLRIHYFGRPQDEQDFEHILKEQHDQVKNTNFRHFLECIEKCRNECIEKCRNARLPADFEEFCAYVYHHAAFLISELPSNYSSHDLNLFFEKMNASGRQLTPIDQIKGCYFPRHAGCFDRCLDFEQRFYRPADGQNADENQDSQPRTFYDILADDKRIVEPEPQDFLSENRSGSRSILRPAVLLLHVLRITCGQTVSLDESRLLKTFKEHFESRESDLSMEFLENLQAYREWLDANIIHLQYRDHNSVAYAFFDENEEDTLAPDRHCLRQYESMLYVSSSTSQQWVLDAYLAKDQKSQCLTFQELMKQSMSKRKALPELEKMCYPLIDRYWFWELDFMLWMMFRYPDRLPSELPTIPDLTDDEKEAIRHYVFRPNRSIEHLHPQTPKEEYQDWDENVRNSFGNLALISSSFNSSQGNDGIVAKFLRFRDQIPFCKIESIKMLVMFKLAGGRENGWTPEVAKKHGEAMYEILKTVEEKVCGM